MKFFSRLLAGPLPAAYCGHLVAHAKGQIKAFGEVIGTLDMPEMPDGRFPYCHDCVGGMTIRCAWCREPIRVGDMVTMYMSVGQDRDTKIPAHAVILDAKSRSLVGCTRIGCASSGADYVGTWVPLGKQRNGKWIGGVQPFQSPIGLARETGKMVIINDMHEHARSTSEDRIISPARMAFGT